MDRYQFDQVLRFDCVVRPGRSMLPTQLPAAAQDQLVVAIDYEELPSGRAKGRAIMFQPRREAPGHELGLQPLQSAIRQAYEECDNPSTHYAPGASSIDRELHEPA
jgi:hypothetical protein